MAFQEQEPFPLGSHFTNDAFLEAKVDPLLVRFGAQGLVGPDHDASPLYSHPIGASINTMDSRDVFTQGPCPLGLPDKLTVVHCRLLAP